MIIRSQDKRNIINMANVCHLQVSERNKKSTEPNVFMVDCCFADTGLMIIATYSTEEKAVKVLEMIQDTYARGKIYDCVMSGTADTIAGFGEEVTKQAFETAGKVFVFEMPKDCEV